MTSEATKPCTQCGEVLPLSAFHKAKKYAAGVAPECRKCNQSYYHKRRLLDPVGVWSTLAYHAARRRAEKTAVPFAVTAAFLASIAPAVCPVFGVPLNYAGSKTNVPVSGPYSPSVDRIVPAAGYVPGNVIVVSMRANLIKQDASPAEILAVGQFYRDLLHHKEH